ncbi:hypothetical protein H0H92_011969, partial [Tricholoma furcatifolium]
PPNDGVNDDHDDSDTDGTNLQTGGSDAEGSNPRQSRTQRGSLRYLVNHKSASDTDDNSEDLTFDPTKITLANLFDFESSQWSNQIKKLLLQGLESELELYELLEMDAEGDEEVDEALDSMTQAALDTI